MLLPGGHGGAPFHDPAGGKQMVSPRAIAQTLGAADSSVKLVVLHACFTAPIADACWRASTASPA